MIHRSRPSGSRRLRPCTALLPALLPALFVATAACGQVLVKCVDRDGNITYQDSPCTTGQAGRPMELPKAETREDTSAWESAARDGKVVKGMPKRWVLRARGTPAEIKPGTARDGATEIWRYADKLGATSVGFAGGDVAWVRDGAAADGTAPPAVAAAGAGTGTPAPSLQGAQNRRFVIAGRFCEHVFAEIGAADRQAPAGSGAVRYFYEPKEGDPRMRTAFTCADGKVADVERVLVQ